MLKKLLLSVTACACMFPAFAQHNRRVLIEEFTNASCPPCAANNPGFNSRIDANIAKLTPIKYQTDWPGYDPMNEQNPSEVQTRVTYYGVTGVPNARQNGTFEIASPLTAFNATGIDAAYNNLTPVTINLTHQLTAGYDSILVNVEVKSDAALTGGLRLHVAVIEEEILFDAPPGSTNEKEFSYVMRKMLPNASGTTTGDFAAGETKTYSFVWPIAYAYNLNEVAAAAFLQNNDTKEVFQSALSTAIGGLLDAGVKVQGAFSFNCVAGISPKFSLTNTGLGNLNSVNMRYRVNGGAWVDYTWEGDLAPGESDVVTLTNVVISESGTANVDVQLKGSNNGIQLNLVDATSTISVRSLLDPATAIPFQDNFSTAVSSLPPHWTVVNPAGGNGWRHAIYAGTNRGARCNMYDIPDGNKAYLTSPMLDLSTASGPTSLRFDHAYTYYDATFFDSLRVEVSADCGVTWTTIFHNGKDGLATKAPQTGAFTPSSTQWRNNNLDLTTFNGSQILIRFVAESGFGNNLWLDNINVALTTSVKELDLNEFTLSPNPTQEAANLRFSLVNTESIRILVFNAMGALVQSHELGDLSAGTHNFRLDPVHLANGAYRVVLQGKEGVANKQWVVLK